MNVNFTFEQLPEAVSELTKKVSELTRLITEKHHPTESPDQWLDLNELVEYDPERRVKATWYSKISKGEVPHHKRSKKLYFLKSEIDEWLKSGRHKTNSEIEAEAHTYLVTNRKGLQDGK